MLRILATLSNDSRAVRVSGTYGGQIREEKKQIAVPLRPLTQPLPFNNAAAEHATMAGLMKDVGASYGCHNSVRGRGAAP